MGFSYQKPKPKVGVWLSDRVLAKHAAEDVGTIPRTGRKTRVEWIHTYNPSRRQRQESPELENSLDCIGSPCLQTTITRNQCMKNLATLPCLPQPTPVSHPPLRHLQVALFRHTSIISLHEKSLEAPGTLKLTGQAVVAPTRKVQGDPKWEWKKTICMASVCSVALRQGLLVA